MAQSHEKLVEEWLRRNRYFTIRSARIGYSEIDLLALKVEKTEKDGKLIDKIVRRHIEVQISLKPVSYITQNHAKKRTPEQIEKDVDSWVHKKYFSHTNKSVHYKNLTKNMILNQWCAIEAAIKWDHGKLAKDIIHWQYFEKPNKLIHKKKNIHLNYSQINFHNWTIALAYEEKTSLNPEIICCSKNF